MVLTRSVLSASYCFSGNRGDLVAEYRKYHVICARDIWFLAAYDLKNPSADTVTYHCRLVNLATHNHGHTVILTAWICDKFDCSVLAPERFSILIHKTETTVAMKSVFAIYHW